MAKHRVPRTHNGGTMTKAMVMSTIRSCLRRNLFRYNWVPRKQCLARASRPAKRARAKTEYQCAVCHSWFIRREVEVDHVVPCGSMRDWHEIGPWIERYLCEDAGGWQLLCKPCHKAKTKEERSS